jgi:bifunctional DNase/RNase
MTEESRSVLLVLRPEQSVSREDKIATRVLALAIGLEEARSIYVAHNKVSVPRPLSHDLMKTIIGEYGGAITGCVITKMESETYFAEIRLKRDGREFIIDCRPSDAIALALRSKAPIYVAREVIEKHGVDPARPEKPDKGVTT